MLARAIATHGGLGCDCAAIATTGLCIDVTVGGYPALVVGRAFLQRARREGGADGAVLSTKLPMTVIATNTTLVTFINVFIVAPANQQRLVDLLAQVTETTVRRARGFVSSSLHRSLDGTKVTMYAQWRTMEEYDAMRKDPRPTPFLLEALGFATFEPGAYEVVQTFAP